MKKIPIIGLIVGAIAAFFAMRKRKKDEPAIPSDSPSEPPPA